MSTEMALEAGAKLVEGVTGPFWLPPSIPPGQGNQISPAMDWLTKVFQEGVRPSNVNYGGTSYEAGFAGGLSVFQILKNAVKQVGWQKLDGTAVYNATSNVKNMDLGGITTFGLAPGTRTNNLYQIFQYKNGILMSISADWMTTPDIRPAEFRTKDYGWTAAGWPKGWFK